MDRFGWSPTPGAKTAARPRVRKHQFGDGYTQRAPDGINTDLRTFSVTFTDSLEEIQAIDDFFTDHGGVRAFLYCPFGQWKDKTVVCEEWDPVYFNTYATLTATFKEVPA